MTFDPVLQVRAVLEEGMKVPMEYIKLFDQYQPLISREVRSCPLMIESQLGRRTLCTGMILGICKHMSMNRA